MSALPVAAGIPRPLGWLAGAVILTWLAWLVVVYGMANHAALEEKDPEAALAWLHDHADANLDLGLQDFQRDPESAERRLRIAIKANPADGRSYAALGTILEARGRHEQADKAMETAARLAPQRSDVQLQAGAYWTRRGDPVRALRHLDTVLRHQQEARGMLFPELLKIMQNPSNHVAMESLLQRPVSWWSPFFVFAARNAESLDTVRGLYRLKQGANTLPPEGLAAYLERLQKDGDWTEAWFVWLNSLSREDITQSGYVYNGSFERPFTNLGFDWIYHRDPAVILENAATYGTTGERALHLIFRGVRTRFRNLGQYLLLPPGQYYLQGRVRPERLETAQGMRWVVACNGKNEPLAATDAFKGSDQWSRFRVKFVVDGSCPVQKLELELVGKINLDFDATGSIWFDDLSVEQSGSAEPG